MDSWTCLCKDFVMDGGKRGKVTNVCVIVPNMKSALIVITIVVAF